MTFNNKLSFLTYRSEVQRLFWLQLGWAGLGSRPWVAFNFVPQVFILGPVPTVIFSSQDSGNDYKRTSQTTHTFKASIHITSTNNPLLLLLLLSRFSRVQLCATPKTAVHQVPPSLGFSRQKYWSGLPFPSPMHESEKWKWSHSVMSDS